MFPTNGCFDKCNKKGRSPCLFERNDGPNFPHLCLYQQFFTRVISRYIFRQLEARVFEVKMKKKTSKLQSFERGEKFICNLQKLFTYISNYYCSKRSSRRCFQGNNFHHQVTRFQLCLFFLPSIIFLNFSKFLISTQKICSEKQRSPRSFKS